MIRELVLRSVICAASLVCSGATTVACVADVDPVRRVEVRVTVTTNGAPFPAGTYITMSAPGEVQNTIVDVPTDVNGQAVLVGEYPADTDEVVVSIPMLVYWGPEGQMAAKSSAAEFAHRAFSIPPPKFVALQSGQEVYAVGFSAPEAITVRGRTVDAAGTHLACIAQRGGMFDPRLTLESEGGYFGVGGVPKGQDSFLFLGTNRREKAVVWLSAAQTVADLNLGDVVVPVAAADAEVQLTVTGRETVRDDYGMQRDRVTLIREDGLAVYTFDITENGEITHSPSEAFSGPVRVRAGRYYIVPGMDSTSDSVLKALRLIRNGQRALLDAAGVSVIESVAKQMTAGAIDLGAVQQIIDGLP